MDDWRMLHQLSVQLLNSDSTSSKLQRILAALIGFHKTFKATISLLDPATQLMTVRASIGIDEAEVREFSGIPPGQGLCGAGFARGRRTVIDNFQTDDTCGDFSAWAVRHGIAAGYATPLFDAMGKSLGVITVYFATPYVPEQREIELTEICAGTIASILEREAIETRLRAEKDRRDDVLSGMGEALCIVDHDFIVLEMNAAALRINKRTAEEMIGRSHWELWPETMHSPLGHAYRRAMQERIPARLENVWTDPEGTTAWFELTAVPITEGLALYFRDITERKLADQAIADAGKRYKVLSETVSDLVWHADSFGKPIDDTQSWRRYTGNYSAELRWIDSVHPDDCSMVQNAWRQYLEEGRPAEHVFRVRRADGQYRYLLSRAVPLKDASGAVREWIGTCSDITDDIMHQETMRLADERKNQFLAILSHELRNPLAATGMAAKLIGSPNATIGRAVHLSEVIQRQVGHMSRLVEDLIDVSRVSEGLIILQKEPVDIVAIAKEATEQIRPMVSAKNHTLTLDLPVSPCILTGDRTRLVQVLTNLLSNAARYTPANGIIRLQIAAAFDAITIRVIDNGIGIDAESISSLFDFYTQAERSSDRKNGGLGLGLALVKSLVDLHRGTIDVISDGEGLGSTFQLTLPRQPDGSLLGAALATRNEHTNGKP